MPLELQAWEPAPLAILDLLRLTITVGNFRRILNVVYHTHMSVINERLATRRSPLVFIFITVFIDLLGFGIVLPTLLR